MLDVPSVFAGARRSGRLLTRDGAGPRIETRKIGDEVVDDGDRGRGLRLEECVSVPSAADEL